MKKNSKIANLTLKCQNPCSSTHTHTHTHTDVLKD